MNHHHTSIVWFRKDLRLEDNPALMAAIDQGGPIVALYIWDPHPSQHWAMGSASKWWLHQSLTNLDTSLIKLGSHLTVCRGNYLETLEKVIRQTGATGVFWNRLYEPSFRIIEPKIIKRLEQLEIAVQTFNGSWLYDPDTLTNKSGKAYQVFTPFWAHCLKSAKPHTPVPSPTRLPQSVTIPTSIPIQELQLEPQLNWADGFRDTWTPGEVGAKLQFSRFMNHGLFNYETDRDRPDFCGSSRLSPHLQFGEISPRRIWHDITGSVHSKNEKNFYRQAQIFLRQLGWREFANHLLLHFPHTTIKPLRSKFERIPWKTDGVHLQAWQKGQTGYPIVDAGMRELWTTGWMHNRVRMIVASFLTKHLQISWYRGAEWFWDTLVDADLANNTLGWQWVAGCGADAAPYFRIFNPVTQGLKFDPIGTYVRNWVPELANLPYPWIHKPWESPPLLLQEKGITLGKDYPFPIVDHREAREQALQMYAGLKTESSLGTLSGVGSDTLQRKKAKPG